MGFFNKSNTPPKQLQRNDIESIDEMLELTKKLLSYVDSVDELSEISKVIHKHPFKYKKSYKLHDGIHSITTYYNSNPNSALLTGNTAIITKETDTAIIEYAYKALIIRDYRNSAISLVEDAISNRTNIPESTPKTQAILDGTPDSPVKPITERSAENPTTTAEKKFCPYCGAKLIPGSKFCPTCGKQL